MRPTFAFLLFNICLFRWAAAQSPEACNKHLQIREATKETWSPGVVRKNSDQAGGVIYEVKIKIRKSGSINFQKLITDGQSFDIELVKDGERNAHGPFKKGDEVKLIARTDKKQEATKADDSVMKMLAEKDATSAILYTSKKKQYYHTLPEFSPRQSDQLIR